MSSDVHTVHLEVVSDSQHSPGTPLFQASMIRAFLLAATFAAGLCSVARADLIRADHDTRHGFHAGGAHDGGAALAQLLARAGTLALAEAAARYRTTWGMRSQVAPHHGRIILHRPHGPLSCFDGIPATRLLFGHGVAAGLLSTPPPQA
ncbi:MAG TPA: hypothetical protein VFZ69_06545 [Longimicrobiales bacterium]